jgi:hypothetical protein
MTVKDNSLYKTGTPVIQNFTTETGLQQEILIPENHDTIIGIVAGSSDSITLKCRLFENGELHTLEENIINNYKPVVLKRKVYSVAINIVTNVSNSISFEVGSQNRR